VQVVVDAHAAKRRVLKIHKAALGLAAQQGAAAYAVRPGITAPKNHFGQRS
jgi:hypothetical protein